MPKLTPEEARATCEALGLHMSRRGKDIIDHIAQLEAENKALRESLLAEIERLRGELAAVECLRVKALEWATARQHVIGYTGTAGTEQMTQLNAALFLAEVELEDAVRRFHCPQLYPHPASAAQPGSDATAIIADLAAEHAPLLDALAHDDPSRMTASAEPPGDDWEEPECYRCDGTGELETDLDGWHDGNPVTCPDCDGTGRNSAAQPGSDATPQSEIAELRERLSYYSVGRPLVDTIAAVLKLAAGWLLDDVERCSYRAWFDGPRGKHDPSGMAYYGACKDHDAALQIIALCKAHLEAGRGGKHDPDTNGVCPWIALTPEEPQP